MKKLMRFCSFIFIALALFIMTACSGSGSKIEAEMKTVSTRSKITVNITFSDNAYLKNGKAKPHIKLYQIDDDGEEVYKDKDLAVKFENQIFTSASVQFENLSFNTEYVFYLYVTLNGKDEKITSIKAKTLASGNTADNATQITNAAEFIEMGNDPEGYYVLMNDIDFNGVTLDSIFTSTSSKQFKGTFDGQDFTISNFSLKSDSNIGVFGYTSQATIKNLNVSDVKGDFSRSTSNIGVLVANANKTTIENCSVNNVDLKIKCQTTAEYNVGGVIGIGIDLSIKNVTASNIKITYTTGRLKVSSGLFAGKIKGSALNNDNVLIENCSADGNITAALTYSSSQGYVYFGGFIGNLGSAALIKNCSAVSDILVSKNVGKDYGYYFNLGVGGFLGINNEGSINFNGCAAISDINIYAGALPEEGVSVDYKDAAMCEDYGKEYNDKGDKNTDYVAYNTYVGGFAGKTIDLFARIENCAYVKKANGINVNASEINSNERKYLFVDEVIGLNTDSADKIVNVFSSSDEDADYSVFTEAIQTLIQSYLD